MADESSIWHKPSSFKERLQAFFNWFFHLPKFILIIIVMLIIVLVVNIVLFTKAYLIFQKEQPSIIATVGDRKITKEQFLEQVKLEEGFLKDASPSASKKEIQNTAKEKLILRAIIETEAKNRGITVTDTEITEEIQSRIEKAGGRENINITLKSYGWSEKDFRQIVYDDLLEKKLRNEIEGWSDIEGVLFWFNPKTKERQKVQEIAEWLKTQFEAGKNLSQVFSELKEKTKDQVAINRVEQKIIHSQLDTWYPGLLKFILSLEKDQVSIFDSGNMLISTIHVRNKHGGPDWEIWLKERSKKVSDSNVSSILTFIFKSVGKFLLPQVVEAADLCSPPYLCETSTTACPDSSAACYWPVGGGPCPAAAPVLCLPSLARVFVNVWDPLGNLVNATVVGSNSAVCFNSSPGVLQAGGYYLISNLNCCSGGPTTIRCSKAGYNDGYASIAQGALINGGSVAISCTLRPIVPPPTSTPTPTPTSTPTPPPSCTLDCSYPTTDANCPVTGTTLCSGKKDAGNVCQWENGCSTCTCIPPSPTPTPSPSPSPTPGSDQPCNSCSNGGGGCPVSQTRCYSNTGADMGCRPKNECFVDRGGVCRWDPTNCIIPPSDMFCYECKPPLNYCEQASHTISWETIPPFDCGSNWAQDSHGPPRDLIQEAADNCNYLGCGDPWGVASVDIKGCICGDDALTGITTIPAVPPLGASFTVEVTSYKNYDQGSGGNPNQVARPVYLSVTTPTGQTYTLNKTSPGYTRLTRSISTYGPPGNGCSRGPGSLGYGWGAYSGPWTQYVWQWTIPNAVQGNYSFKFLVDQTNWDCAATSVATATPPPCNNTPLTITPNPANVGATMYFKYNPGQDGNLGGDTWNPPPPTSVSGCYLDTSNSFLNRQYICTAAQTTTGGIWTHKWNNQSCSKTSPTYTINTPRPPLPTIAPPACIFSGYNGSGVTISWGATTPPVSYVDISADSNFIPYYNKAVTTTSTSAPAGFSGSLTLNPGITYYVRTWNGSLHSPTATFNIPLCIPGPPTGLSASCPIPGTTATLNWIAPSTGADFYALMVDNLANSWNGCSPPNAGDFCNYEFGTSSQFTSTPGASYSWGVFAGNSAGWSSPTIGSNFTCGLSACPGGLGACGDSLPNLNTIGACNGTWVHNPGPAPFLPYNIWCATNANPTRGYCYQCDTTITPWIQTTGDVHSNTGINAAGGP